MFIFYHYLRKKQRQRAILDLLSKRPVPNQAQLISELAKMNIAVTQATISRDISELQLKKSRKGYVCQDQVGAMKRLFDLTPKKLIRMSVTRAEAVLSCVVVHTVDSMAPCTAAALDGPGFNETMGTVADHRTVLVITGCPEDAQRIKDKIEKIIS